ncbi:hypothetical protein WH47_09660 [Habropoda laboriosa]|uniref:Uncharacterized protein n=2 Tax=Habropoda laboriosa TaxID=597456 RepID=A0A0L7RE29_9HYME|nr:hypothetical protein WH47_09660 [Habropoda laboriosa]
MVVSRSSESTAASDTKDNPNEEERSDENSLIKNGKKASSEGNLEKQSSLRIEPLTNYSQGYSSFSARLPSTRNPYRNQRDDSDSDSSRSQRNASFLRLYSSISCENSAKNRVELQPHSPVSLCNARPTKFGGYRPPTGVILQNLSSGSEAESSHEITSNRIGSTQRIDRLVSNTIAVTDNSADLCDKNSKITNFNEPLPPLSSRRSPNRMLLNSSRKDVLESVIASSVSKMDFTDDQFCKNSKDPLNTTCLPSSRKMPPENSYYRNADTSRSDCSKNMKNFYKNVEEPMFYSAREEVCNFNREGLETSPSLLKTANPSNISPQSSEAKTSRNFQRDTINLEKHICNEGTRRGDEEKEEEMNSSNSGSRVNESQSFVPTQRSTRLPENILKSSDDNLEISSSNITDSRVLQEAMSRYILNYDSNNDIKSPQSQENASSPQLKNYSSDIQSVASSSGEYFVDEFTKNHGETKLSLEFTKIDQELHDQELNEITNEKGFASVPTLTLNSQEVSHTTSPASKISSERRLDADSLIRTLSNSSLRQQTTKDASENTCSESCIDSKTISRQGSSENNLSTDKRLESTSLKSDEHHSRLSTSRTSCRSFLSTRSKIPVKIPTNRSKLPIVNTLNEVEKPVDNQGASLMDSDRQVFRNDPSSSEEFQSGRRDQVSRSEENSPLVKHYLVTNIEESVEVVSESSVNTDRKEEDKYPDTKCRGNELENFERTSLTMKDRAQLRTCLPLQIETSDEETYESKVKEQIQDYRANLDGTNYNESSINRTNVSDTFSSSNSPDNQKERETVHEKTKSEHSDYSDTDSDTSSSSSHCYKIRESAPKLEEPEELDEPEEPTNFISRITSITSPLEDYQRKYLNTTYEGEVFDRFVEKRKSNLFENQIGDGNYQEALMEDSSKLNLQVTPLNSSPENEELLQVKRVAENYDKLNFSMEKLAAEQFRRNINPEYAKSIQSDTTAFFTERFYEVPQFSLACSSSTSKLRRDRSRDSPRVKKKSQDRFPFTISEKTSVASMKFKVRSRLGNLDEDEEEKSYKLDTHPSITRLAGSGFEDSPAEIISYMVNTEQEDRRTKSSGMRGLVEKFSARWRKSRKHDDEMKSDAKMTNVIFKNRDYREECDSSMESCSESSLLRDFRLFENLEKKFSKIGDSPDEKPLIEKKSSTRENSGNTSLNAENPCRRYDRDDLWVQAFKNFDSDREEKKKDESISEKDPYSVFFVKSARETPEISARALLSEDDNRKQNISTERKKNRVKFRGSSLAVAPKRSDENVHKESIKNKNSERVKRNKNMQSGCLCLRFYRMIVPVSFGSISKYRSQVNRNSSSIKKKSRTSLHKKKG